MYSTLLTFCIFLVFFVQCQPNYQQGEKLYMNHCSNCHMEDGTGLVELIPPIINSDYYKKNIKNLPCIIKHGLNDSIKVNDKNYSQPMEAIKTITDTEIINIINFINHQWYPEFDETSVKEFKNNLKNCESIQLKKNVRKTR